MAELDAEARSIFLSLVDRLQDEWQAALTKMCPDQPALRAKVVRLLADHVMLGTVSQGHDFERTSAAVSDLEAPGTVIAGQYKLLERLGEGGFGLVYLAEQTTPVRRKVAVKILKAGMDTRQVIARFEAERQALAIMDHPNIARIFDGGVTPTGRPFFAMEYVKGVPITDFCDQNRFTLRQRLELFVQVCHAVQHAHQKGIIHRDIKPSNVLVSRHDTTPVVKVIDFGVAKALGQVLTDRTLFTAVAQMIGTPLYMSPEQAGMSDLDVDTRSDVYSLGVLLYELLTGTTPITRERFKQAEFDEIRWIIREEDPPKPSTRLSTDETLPNIAANRNVEPRKLSGLLRGELDWVVMKSLEKDRNRRYESANGFAADVQRYLVGDAVLAVPPSTIYRMRKFVRRHKGKVIAAGLIVAALIAGVAGTSWGYLRAEKRRVEAEDARKDMEAAKTRAEEAEAQTLADFRASTDDAIKRLIGSKPELNEDEQIYIRSALERWQAFANRQGDAPKAMELRAEGHYQVGALWQHLGNLDQSLDEYRSAATILKGLASNHPDPDGRVRHLASKSLLNAGKCLKFLGKHAEAMDCLDEAGRIQSELNSAFPSSEDFKYNSAAILIARAYLNSALSNHVAAISLCEKAIDGFRELSTAFPDASGYRAELANALGYLGAKYTQVGDRGVALKRLLEAIAIYEELAKRHPRKSDYRFFQSNLIADTAVALRHAGKLNDVSERYLQAIAISEELVRKYLSIGTYSAGLAAKWVNHAVVLTDLQLRPKAEEQLRKALALRRRLADDYPKITEYKRDLAINHNNLGSSIERQGRAREAIEHFRAALAIQEPLAAQNPNLAVLLNEIAQTYGSLCLAHQSLRQFSEALEFGGKSLEIKRRLVNDFPDVKTYRLNLAAQYSDLALAMFDAGDRADCFKRMDEAHDAIRPLLTTDPNDARTRVVVHLIHAGRAHMHHLSKQYREAVAELDKALQYCRPLERSLREASRAVALMKCGRAAEALADADRLTKIRKWPGTKWFDFACIYSLAAAGDAPNKEAHAKRAIELLRESANAGFLNVDHFKRDSDLDSLRNREDFKKLIADLEAKTPPKSKVAPPRQEPQ